MGSSYFFTVIFSIFIKKKIKHEINKQLKTRVEFALHFMLSLNILLESSDIGLTETIILNLCFRCLLTIIGVSDC